MTKRAKRRLMFLGVGVLLLIGVVAIQLPTLAAGLILHSLRRHVRVAPPVGCHEVSFKGEGISLRGWRGKASGVRRGTLIYLHGVADNRASGAGVLDRFRMRGFDVVAYDSRAHGDSGGDAATYGFFEKEDLRRVLDGIDAGPIVLIGSSLGAAVALQAAAVDQRISAVVAAEVFSDLQTVVKERAPFFISAGNVDKAIQVTEQNGKFRMGAVSPELAARTIKVPVLLIHGADDTDTLPDHSRRVFAALDGPKRLILVPGAKHNQSLHGAVWEDIERWVDAVVGHSPDVQSVDPKQRLK